MKPATLIFVCLLFSALCTAQVTTTVNPNGTHSTTYQNGNTSTTVNPDGTHSATLQNGNSSTTIYPNGTHSTTYQNGNTATTVNPDGTQNTSMNNGNTNIQNNTVPVNANYQKINHVEQRRLNEVKESRPDIYSSKKTKVKILKSDDEEPEGKKRKSKKKRRLTDAKQF